MGAKTTVVADAYGQVGPPPLGMRLAEKAAWKQRADDWPFLTREHRAALQLHSELWALYKEEYATLRDEGIVLQRSTGGYYPNPRATVVDRLRKQLNDNLKAFGATPVSRKGVKPVEGETKDESDPYLS